MKRLKDLSTIAPESMVKDEAKEQLEKYCKRLFSLQNIFYANKNHSLLIVLQGMDTSGKDGTIRHVFSHINPEGCRVKSFKAPSDEEQLHDFLWRIYASLPERGMIQIFNRSHYEDILFPVVHELINKNEIKGRKKVINEFEDHLNKSNTIILKFFLHISRGEQQNRIEKRLNDPNKKWKYNPADKKEAKYWSKYMHAYQSVIDNCSAKYPWFIIPSDQKWYRNYLIAKTITEALESLNMKYPDPKF